MWYSPRVSAAPSAANPETPRHTAVVRATHWLTFLAFVALVISGYEIVISHPRFYWGEVGNVRTVPLFTIPIPASRDTVPTRFNYVMPDQNGWSRYLHFQAAWLVVLTGVVYVLTGLWSGHFRKDLIPDATDRTWRAYRHVLARYRYRAPPLAAEAHTYNVVQRAVYLTVIFVLFPLMIWTGLAMSPAFVSALPATVTLLGGRQTARTLHFFVSGALLLFFVTHVTMVTLAGFRNRMRSMITGRVEAEQPGTLEGV